MQIFYEQRLKITDITTEKVRAALKAKRQRRYYENVQLIHSLITGQQPMRFTPEQEARLRAMFSQIQDPFEKNCPSTRKNFLSYSYVLYKFVELLALDYFKSSFLAPQGTRQAVSARPDLAENLRGPGLGVHSFHLRKRARLRARVEKKTVIVLLLSHFQRTMQGTSKMPQ